MDWNAVGAVGQILGSLATFVTVGYLVVQVRIAEKERRRAIAQSRQERNIQINLAAATNERLAAIHMKGNAAQVSVPPSTQLVALLERMGLTGEEFMLLNWELAARWNNTSQTVLYLEELSADDREQFDRSTRSGWSEPIVRLWYEFAKAGFSPTTVRYVDELLARPGMGPLFLAPADAVQSR